MNNKIGRINITNGGGGVQICTKIRVNYYLEDYV